MKRIAALSFARMNGGLSRLRKTTYGKVGWVFLKRASKPCSSHKILSPMALSFVMLFPVLASASWVSQFGISEQQYRVYVKSNDAFSTTAGFFLTSFPCYSQNSSEYYTTANGNNILTLFCLQPPEEIRLSYVTKKRGEFIAKNERVEGYFSCPVDIYGVTKTSSVPKLEITLENCAKYAVDPKANRLFLQAGSAKGEAVGDFMKKEEASAVATSIIQVIPMEGVGSIPYIVGTEP